MNIYSEDISYELTDDEIQEIETQMMTEFDIIKENPPSCFLNNYIINGKSFILPGLWSSQNPLSNIEYLLSGQMDNQIYPVTFHGSLTDRLCRKIHYQHKQDADALTARKIINKQGNW
jgi:hypothetical protein